MLTNRIGIFILTLVTVIITIIVAFICNSIFKNKIINKKNKLMEECEKKTLSEKLKSFKLELEDDIDINISTEYSNCFVISISLVFSYSIYKTSDIKNSISDYKSDEISKSTTNTIQNIENLKDIASKNLDLGLEFALFFIFILVLILFIYRISILKKYNDYKKDLLKEIFDMEEEINNNLYKSNNENLKTLLEDIIKESLINKIENSTQPIKIYLTDINEDKYKTLMKNENQTLKIFIWNKN